MSATCPICDAPQDAGLGCHACMTALEQALAQTAALVTELETTVAKLARIGGAGGKGAPARERNVMNFGASAIADDLSNTLTTWARDLSNDQWRPVLTIRRVFRSTTSGHHGPFCLECDHLSCDQLRVYIHVTHPVPQVVQASRYLLSHVDLIRRHEAAKDLWDEVTDALSRSWSTVDRAGDRQYVGPCRAVAEREFGQTVDCGDELWAKPGATSVRCRTCGADTDVAEQRAEMVTRARPMVVTAKEAALWVTSVGDVEVTESNIRNWVGRGKLLLRPGLSTQRQFELGTLLDYVTARAEDTQRSAAA